MNALLHAVLDAWQPDHVEASSPWSSATMVGRWQGAATRSLVMHADPLAAYAYRWLGGVAPRPRDRPLVRLVLAASARRSGSMFDIGRLRQRRSSPSALPAGGVANTETIRMGVEPGLFSPSLALAGACARRRSRALGLDPDAVLLLGIGRFSAEKRWEMVLRAAGECGRKLPRRRCCSSATGRGARSCEMIAEQYRNVAVLPPIADRAELAPLLASADALVHGCESETFCLVAAEARASGIPLIVPDRGAAVDQLVAGAGTTYSAGASARSSGRSTRFIDRGPELQRAAAVRASRPRTMDEHFADLFASYGSLVAERIDRPAALSAPGVPHLSPELALARASARVR